MGSSVKRKEYYFNNNNVYIALIYQVLMPYNFLTLYLLIYIQSIYRLRIFGLIRPSNGQEKSVRSNSSKTNNALVTPELRSLMGGGSHYLSGDQFARLPYILQKCIHFLQSER